MSVAKIPKQEYTAAFKELGVKRVKSGQAVGAVAKERSFPLPFDFQPIGIVPPIPAHAAQ